MDIGSFLAYRRKQLGLSFSDVGSAIGYTPQAIYRYEKGIVKIDLSLVDSFCKVLNLSAEAFFGMDTPIKTRNSPKTPFVPCSKAN